MARKIEAGTWAVIRKDSAKTGDNHFAEVEILDQQGEPTQVGYLKESDIGLKVIIPSENPDR